MTGAIARAGSAAEIGGKAASLAALAAAGLPVPPWFALRAPDGTDPDAPLPEALRDELCAAVRALAPGSQLLAVRSSAVEEDGAAHSFAGQFESYLNVSPVDVPERVRDVWRAARAERVTAYRAQHGLAHGTLPAALVQRMVNADAAGVAFSADPVSGRRAVCVVSAVRGLGDRLVSGEADADLWHVDRAGAVVHRAIVGDRPALDDDTVRRVADLARAAERHFGRPQDVEWAIESGTLWLLQSRPVTSLAALPDPDGALAVWDDSNIAESYGGVTTPLTYSFARYVYEAVYRQFCRIVGVPERRIDAEADALRAMLGLVRGRVYYNLVSWYRILALLPGYRLNRPFMEQMMGVKEGLPAEVADRVPAATTRERLADAVALLGTVWGLVRAHARLDRDVASFRSRLDDALGGVDLAAMRPDELVAHYRDLERRLLARWDTPLVNDFFAMIFYGVLRRLAARWCGDADETLQNDLVAGEGAIVSAEPARRIERMAAIAASDPAVVAALCDAAPDAARAAVAAHPVLAAELDDYLATFGDRCLEELKLETETLGDDPLLLVRSVGRLARARGAHPSDRAPRVDVRAAAEARADDALRGHPVRRAIFRWVLRRARRRVRDRENLRFERTRVFGRVRRIFVELGKRYAALGVLDEPRDVFWLTVDEALGWPGATTASADLRPIVAARAAEFARWRAMPAPAGRFDTRGPVHVGHDFLARRADPTPPASLGGDERRGTGCHPGVVRGRVRVVRDPREAVMEPGEILVAERTDPGWVMLFPAASALLVERGSLLSHSAIVARELGLPAVIAIDGLTTWLRTGDEVELDGRTGEVRRL
ncbi:pyruvate phosphate dikinase PEP/pyruvate-binding protein [Gemmatirosa kalamazoonensis]|uniref:Pyruvate phosphate dikinase PEP/pyruvate-binding protein n=1 Tax=Gemmatirosa kalamazoonensis TaxID=861299 RepID=W0RIW5_9BACT|nr:PEP/pyruvate-binding domain-containing protein [Gemmatirosa kalamazoonensis]AHG89353.1 pyruvate phosphate dikinase PEP/pyruvate-binding protein [Gemmatirosa kalamazoonensis]